MYEFQCKISSLTKWILNFDDERLSDEARNASRQEMAMEWPNLLSTEATFLYHFAK